MLKGLRIGRLRNLMFLRCRGQVSSGSDLVRYLDPHFRMSLRTGALIILN